MGVDVVVVDLCDDVSDKRGLFVLERKFGVDCYGFDDFVDGERCWWIGLIC